MSELVLDRAERAATCAPQARVTRSLLGYGVLAGPFYVLAALGQAFLRPGFDPLHDDVSLLSNGAWGWVQMANFVLTGAMVIACSVGVRRALNGGRAGTWAPRLLGLYGLALVAAGVFVADPMNAFPPGTAAGHPATISWHGMLHMAAAGVGFLGLVAASWLVGSRFAAEDRRGWAWFSRLTGVLFLLAFAGLASGSSSAAVVLAFWAALVIAWGWLAALSIELYRR